MPIAVGVDPLSQAGAFRCPFGVVEELSRTTGIEARHSLTRFQRRQAMAQTVAMAAALGSTRRRGGGGGLVAGAPRTSFRESLGFLLRAGTCASRSGRWRGKGFSVRALRVGFGSEWLLFGIRAGFCRGLHRRGR